MALVINTNIASLNAQRQLVSSGRELAQASERLASGRRINSAADDAAGLVISNRMTSQIRGLAQAQRNALDGISLIQVAEGALDESTNNLQRITLDAEVQQLIAEVDRIADTTQFNGERVLDGSMSTVELQVGAEANQSISFSLSAMDASSLGLGSTIGDIVGAQMSLDGSGGLSSAIDYSAIKINGNSVGGYAAGSSLQDVVDDLNENVPGLSVSAVVSVVSPTKGDGILQGSDALNITARGLSGTAYSFTVSDTNSMDELVEAVNRKTGNLIHAEVDEDGAFVLSSDSMASITIQDTTQGTATGVNQTSIADPDIAAVVEGLTSSWVAEAEARVQTYFGLSGNNVDLNVDLTTSDGVGNSLASVSSTADPDVFTLNIDMADFSDTGVSSGGSPPLYMDRIIGHEMVHAAMFSTFGTAAMAALPGWFIEGTAEFIHGADERVNGDALDLEDQAEINVAFGEAKALGSSPSTSRGYSASYIATKLIHEEIVDAGGTGIIEVISELEGGSTLDQALNTVGTNRGLSYNSVATFETYFESGTVAEDFLNNDMNLGDADTGAIGGSDYGGAALTEENVYPNAALGLPSTYNLVLPDEYTGGLLTSTAQLVMTSDDGGSIEIDLGAAGEDTDLVAFGLQKAAQGMVLGQELSATNQNAALGTNDLIINGVSISAVDANSGLMAKVDAINDVSDESGVVASIAAEQSFDFNRNAASTVEWRSSGSLSIVNNGLLGLNGIGLTVAAGESATDIAATVNNSHSFHGVSAYADDSGRLHLFSESVITFGDSVGGALVTELGLASDLTAGSVNINGVDVSLTNFTDQQTLLDDLNAQTGSTGVTAAIDNNGEIELTSSSAIQIRVGDTNGMRSLNAMGMSFGVSGSELLTDSDNDDLFGDEVFTIASRIKLDSFNDAQISVEVTEDGATATGLSDFNAEVAGLSGVSLSSISVANASNAQKAIDVVDNALESINAVRSELGAVNNRLEFTLSNLSNISEKTLAARSRIVDADYASETSKLTRAQVLQQASQAMLAQANAQPRSVLQLIA